MANIIAILNEKGGVGKTTSTATLSHALARRGRAVLAVDLDPQANLTAWIGNAAPEATAANVLLDHRAAPHAVGRSSASDVALLYGSRDVADAADDLRASSPAPALALRRALKALSESYEYIILDCPPGVGVLSVNAMVAADSILVPIDSQAMALSGLIQLQRSLSELAEAEIIASVPKMSAFLTRFDSRLGLARDVRDYLAGNESPIRVHDATVRVSTRLAECYGHAKTIYDYAPGEAVASDYANLAQEIDK